ncbi:MAG: universal stress protein UspA related nucleotide-binding protein [Haloquadratum walsbyi J07HQW1]|jgi:Universal stress protein UspA and related nucleotide-binding proteins|uniref:Universal stress protein UspA related nucleotide-binding protein n=1 Tax=Haloquadratum walsbyi J07HQW1 TaxID=1238424 RepID=U1N5W2_9EURY|nr:MAG: universal stress protein UspA related nucleotide-binding protein [Haloquadratum walsbyi J07HQW1]
MYKIVDDEYLRCMYDRILIPTDGSECADEAVTHALDLATQYDADVHVLSVVDARDVSHGAPAISPAQVESTLRENAHEVTDAVADRAADTEVDVTPAVEAGIPDDSIVTYAEEHDIDLIVMGTHGRTGLERYLLGSVTERTVRRSSVPVLTVRTDTDAT